MGDRDKLKDSTAALKPGSESRAVVTPATSRVAETDLPADHSVPGDSASGDGSGPDMSHDGVPESDDRPSKENNGSREDEAKPGFLQSLPEFSSRHRMGVKTVTGLLLGILAIEWIVIATETPDPLLLERGEAFRQQFRVEINSAIWVEWLQLEGIGPSLAHRIVAWRTLNGPFKSVDDVGRVPGIGPATLDRIRPWLTMHHDLSEPQIPAAVPSSSLKSTGDAHRGR